MAVDSLVNHSAVPQKLQAAKLGSRCGDTPKLQVDIWGPDHRPVQIGMGRYGNVNPLTDGDIHELARGKSNNVIGKGSFGHYLLNARTLTIPGKYRLRAIYDTKTPGTGGLGDRGHRPMDVAPVRLVTKTIEVEVLPAGEQSFSFVQHDLGFVKT